MTPYFADSANVARLQVVAATWLGTPYVQSGAIKGCGASCHRLAAAVLAEAGVDMSDVPERGQIGRRLFAVAMEDWFASRPDRFAAVPVGDPLLPGDLLQLDYGVGHIALYIGGTGQRVLQVLLHASTHMTSLADQRLADRLRAVWRPLDKEVQHG